MYKLTNELQIQEVREHRKDNCLHYESCLTEASTLLWPSFSCKGCTNYCPHEDKTLISYERACNPLAWEA